MSEGLLKEVLGAEDERQEWEATSSASNSEALALAIATLATRHDPELTRITATFLKAQTALLRIQKAHLKDEHAARLHFLRGQSREVDIRRLGLRVRVGLQLLLVMGAALISAWALILAHDAINSRSVVIEPFEIAPNVAPHVPTGRMVSASLLDVLTRIQSATRSSAARRSLTSAWTNDIAIEVPETGVSLGEVQRALKARFGHDIRIEGDLAQDRSGGLALTVRGSGVLPKTFTGEAGELESLLTQAGEYVYGQSQPGLWANFLTNNNRNDDAIRFCRDAFVTADPSERPYILNYWANAIVGKGGDGAMREALPLYQEVVRLKPDYWNGYNNTMFALEGLGEEEAAVRVGERMLKAAGGRPGKAPESQYQNYDQMAWDLPAFKAEQLADMDEHSGIGTMGTIVGAESLSVALSDVLMHDATAAQLRLNTTVVDDKNLPDVAAAAFDQALLAEEQGDWNQAAREWDAYAAAAADPAVAAANPQQICYAAPAYQRTGQSAKADAAFAAVGTKTFVDCYRFRADVLDTRQDWTGAQFWYAKAVALAPSLPSGYFSWGVALARHGDLDAAVEKLALAHSKGPHWADPLKVWGDVLLKKGDNQEALSKYDEALKWAPNWLQLKAARVAAMKPG